MGTQNKVTVLSFSFVGYKFLELKRKHQKVPFWQMAQNPSKTKRSINRLDDQRQFNEKLF